MCHEKTENALYAGLNCKRKDETIMERKLNPLVISAVTLSAFVIPQILFYWLAPKGFEAREAIYTFGTLFTAVSAMAGAGCCCKFGLQKGMPSAVVSAVLGVLVTAVCGVLILLNASLRSSIFAMCIFFPLYLMCLVPLIASAGKRENPDGGYFGLNEDPNRRSAPLPPRRI